MAGAKDHPQKTEAPAFETQDRLSEVLGEETEIQGLQTEALEEAITADKATKMGETVAKMADVSAADPERITTTQIGCLNRDLLPKDAVLQMWWPEKKTGTEALQKTKI